MTRPLPTPEEDLDARQVQKTRTIAACREAARRLFSERTYEAVTIRDLARAMQMSTGAVYANFPDKAAVWRDAMASEPPVDSPLTRAAPQLLAVAVALDAFWTEDFPEGPDGSRAWAGGLGLLSDDTVELWRACRAAIAAARGQPPAPPAQQSEAA